MVCIVRTILLIRVILIREYSYHTHTWIFVSYAYVKWLEVWLKSIRLCLYLYLYLFILKYVVLEYGWTLDVWVFWHIWEQYINSYGLILNSIVRAKICICDPLYLMDIIFSIILNHTISIVFIHVKASMSFHKNTHYGTNTQDI